MSNNECCFKEILSTIECLQNSVDQIEDVPNSCDRPFLGNIGTNNTFLYNTRPLTFYNCNNDLISLPYTLINNGQTISGVSSVFRLQRLNGCCITCMVLAPNPDETQANAIPYVATTSFTTINLNCVCALRCLLDTFINCI